jgi:hypothetical protein
VNAFLKQGPAEHFTLDQTLAQLNGALKPKEPSAQKPVPLKAGR